MSVKPENESYSCVSILCGLLLLSIPLFLYVFLVLEPEGMAREVCADQQQVYFDYLLEGRYEYVICNGGSPPERKLSIYEIPSMRKDHLVVPLRVMAENEQH